MKLLKKLEACAKKMKWYDFSLLKLSVFFFTLFLVAVWTDFRTFVLGFDWYWYLLLAVVFSLPLLKKMFMEK